MKFEINFEIPGTERGDPYTQINSIIWGNLMCSLIQLSKQADACSAQEKTRGT